MPLGPTQRRGWQDTGLGLNSVLAGASRGGGVNQAVADLVRGARGAASAQGAGLDDDPGQILWTPDQVTLGESLFPPVAGRWSITTEVSCGFQVDFDPDTLGPLLPDDRGATDLLAGWRYVQLGVNGVSSTATVQPGQIVPVFGARNTYYADLTTSDDVALVTTPSGGGGPGITVVVVSAYVIVRGARLGPTPDPPT